MKAIVNVNKGSNYARFNGLTFEVAEVLSQQVAILIPSKELGKDVTTDFGHSEIIIVDIEKELQKAYDNYNWGSDIRTYKNLEAYCIKRGIITLKPNYNCPA
jgi:hypothetical protein